MKCRYHPEREAFVVCEKYTRGYCEECCRCNNAESPCSSRISCCIWQFFRPSGKKIGNVGKVLDIGCDEGYLVNCLAKKLNRKVLGFDISNEEFTRAHEKCKQFGTCGLIECMKGDVHNLTGYFPAPFIT